MRLSAPRNRIGTVPGKAEVYEVPNATFSSTTWLPRSASLTTLVAELALRSFPRVGNLFEVQQGVLTGENKIFVATRSFIRGWSLEQKFFHQLQAIQLLVKAELRETNTFGIPTMKTEL